MDATLPRLRHVCLIAPRLEPEVEALRDAFGLEVVYRDPLVERWGIENAMLPVGSGFIEICAPIRADAPSHRFLARRPGGGGYVIAVSCDNLAERRAHLRRRSVRLVSEIELEGFRMMQTHPRDSGACMLEFNSTGARDGDHGAYAPAGPAWPGGAHGAGAATLAAIEIRAFAPERLSAHWADLMQVPLGRNPAGEPSLQLKGGSIRFVPVEDGEGEGLAGIDFVAPGSGGNFAIVCIAGVQVKYSPTERMSASTIAAT